MKSIFSIIIIFLILKAEANQIVSMGLNSNGGLKDMIIEDDESWSQVLNTYLNFTIIKQIERNNTSKIGNNLTIHLSQNLNCNDYHTNIKIESKELFDLKMFVCEGLILSYNEGIGLGYKFTDKSYSFIDKLYDNKQINKLMYTFELKDKKFQFIHFGGVPKNAHIQSTYQGHCNVNENYSSWGCNLTSIKFNGVTYPFNVYTIFHTAFTHTILSDEVFKFFINVILKDLFAHNECHLKNEDQLISCTKKLIAQKEDIVLLEFGDMKLYVPLNKFFNTDYCNLERNNNKYYNQEGIIFGTSFIQYLTYLNFDYETKQISLFSEFISIEMNNHIKASKVIFIINLLICLICIVLDICLKISKKI